MKLGEIISNIAELVDDAICVLEPHPTTEAVRKVLWCNAAFCEMTSFAMEEVVDQPVSKFWGPKTNAETIARISDRLGAEKTFRERHATYRADGSQHYTDIHFKPVLNNAGECVYWLAVSHEVSEFETLLKELEQAHNETNQAQQRLWNAIDALPHAFVIFDAEDKLVLCNDRYKNIHENSAKHIVPGVTLEEILRHGVKWKQFPEAVDDPEAWIAQRLAHHRNPQGPIDLELPGNRFFQIHEVVTGNGDKVGFRFDTTELQRQKQAVELHAKRLSDAMSEAEIASRTDVLTGLGNRRGLQNYLEDLKNRLPEGDEIAVIHVDLDRFKQINDMFGHAAGDHVLRKVAKILLSQVNAEDFVGRIGGDEFTVVLCNSAARPIAERIANGILDKCSVPIEFEGKPCRFGASVGIAIDTAEGIESLLVNADIALYEAKTAGRGRSVFFSKRLRNIAEQKKQLADEILESLETRSFTAHLQPLVSATDRRLVGVEALARWNHPKLGTIAPDVFLPIAEELGVIAQLDKLVMERTFEMVNELNMQGAEIPKVSLNLSYHKLTNPEFISWLTEMPKNDFRLSFELLETIDFDDDQEDVLWTIDSIRELGIEIQIDDFGSGRASMTSLLKVQPDRVKIDRALVAATAIEGANAIQFVKAIGDMAQALDIGLTAEGIETENQAMILTQVGCDVLQGYLISAPLTQQGFLDWTKSNQRTETKPMLRLV